MIAGTHLRRQWTIQVSDKSSIQYWQCPLRAHGGLWLVRQCMRPPLLANQEKYVDFCMVSAREI